MKKIIFIILICLISTMLIPGCLQTKEASPAYVNQATLDSLGWTMSGEPSVESMSQMVGDVEIVINTATVNYIDEDLINDINRQINDLDNSEYPGNREDQFTSLFMTVTVALPAGIIIPEHVLTGIIDTSIKNMQHEHEITEFHQVGEETVTTGTGSTALAGLYEGYTGSSDYEDIKVKIRGVITSWAMEGTTVIVVGVLPAEDITLQIPKDKDSSDNLTINVNEEQEYQDIRMLIQNVE